MEKVTRCPTGYQDFLNESNYCFKEIKNNKTWPTAQQRCYRDGGDLVCFASHEERDFWKAQCDGCWSGYNRLDGTYDMKNMKIRHDIIRFLSKVIIH